jgi:hypothetical protein
VAGSSDGRPGSVEGPSRNGPHGGNAGGLKHSSGQRNLIWLNELMQKQIGQDFFESQSFNDDLSKKVLAECSF